MSDTTLARTEVIEIDLTTGAVIAIDPPDETAEEHPPYRPEPIELGDPWLEIPVVREGFPNVSHVIKTRARPPPASILFFVFHVLKELNEEPRSMNDQQRSDYPAAEGVEFRPIPDCYGYCAGSDGSIWSCLKIVGSQWYGDLRNEPCGPWKRLKPEHRKIDGRKRHTVRRSDGKLIRRYASVLVLLSFRGPCPEGMECCHENGNCLDDRADNLRWDTHSANLLDRRKHGTAVNGSDVHTSKLTEEDVLEIRRIGLPLKQHSIRFGVTEQNVYAILKRKTWKHV